VGAKSRNFLLAIMVTNSSDISTTIGCSQFYASQTSRRQLTPDFDPNLPFHDFPKYFNHE